MTSAAAMSGSFQSLIVVVILSGVAVVTGYGVLASVAPSADKSLAFFPLAFGTGLALLGVVWLILAVINHLTPLSAALTTIGAVAIGMHRLPIRGMPKNSEVETGLILCWPDMLLAAMTIGLTTFAGLAAFVPENQVDATRQHLPIAREIWETGTAAAFDPMSISHFAIQGHVLSAVAFGAGGMAAVKLLQFAISVASISAIAGVAALLAGRRAAIFSAAIFGSMPIVLWESGHALVDLLPVLFTVCATWCVLRWQGDGRISWLVLSGAFLGIGISAKANMVLVAAAFFVAIFVTGRESWSFRARMLAIVSVGLGTLFILPWLLRTYAVNGTLPGMSFVHGILLQMLPHSPVDVSQVAVSELVTSTVATPESLPPPSMQQFGHAPMDFIGLPWFLTFDSRELGFPSVGRGEVGFLMLALFPAWLAAPRNRATAFLALFTVLSYAAWWFTPFQIARHLLPTLATAAILCGVGVAFLLNSRATMRWANGLKNLTAFVTLFCVTLIPFVYLTSARTQIPVPVLTGRASTDSYIQTTIPSGTALLDSAAYLASDEPLLYIGGPVEAPQIYTPARLVFYPADGAGVDAPTVLDTLKTLNVKYFIWNRDDGSLQDWRAYMLSTPFLRQYTRILAGSNNAYLFEVLPTGDTKWGKTSVANVLQDPGLIDTKNERGPWSIEGKSVVAEGVVGLSRRATLTQEVAVSAGNAYVLEAPMRCLEPSGRGILTLRWLDASSQAIGTASEEVLPGQEITDQFLWRRAPENAARVQAEFSMSGQSRCEISGAALYDLG